MILLLLNEPKSEIKSHKTAYVFLDFSLSHTYIHKWIYIYVYVFVYICIFQKGINTTKARRACVHVCVCVLWHKVGMNAEGISRMVHHRII